MKTISVIILALLSAASVFSQDSNADLRFTRDQQRLQQAIGDTSDLYLAAKACQRLAEVGTDESVDRLGELLSHPELSNYARNALEGIGSEKAKAQLRHALATVKGKELLGVIHSLGRMQDKSAVEAMEKMFYSAEPESELEKGLRKALDAIETNGPNQSSSVPISKQRDSFLFNSDGEIDKVAAMDLFTAKSPEEFFASIIYIRQAKAIQAELSREMLRLLPTLSKERWLPTLQAVRDMNTPIDVAPLLELTKNESEDVRAEVIRFVAGGTLENREEILLGFAQSNEPKIADVAKSQLARLTSTKLDDRLMTMLDDADAVKQKLAVELVGERRIEAAASKIARLCNHPNQDIRQAALKALGGCGSIGELPLLLSLAASEADSPSRDAARESVKLACIRLPQEACAGSIAAVIGSASTKTREYLFMQLTRVGEFGH